MADDRLVVNYAEQERRILQDRLAAAVLEAAQWQAIAEALAEQLQAVPDESVEGGAT